ncbi:hypothetical protein [Nocardia bovistercoris]|uniref:Uncharacterized protein n=1 Tax=Nocardia bovistercoris TaxID=2785916 RepID=A0A931IHD5_9NOCA|nr:hypothetical protein [Nocardia bovistercoris]MBH0781421.1 hypothetical protein [Nocardia bovistercoris]
MIDDPDREIPVIRTEVTRQIDDEPCHRVGVNWNLDEEIGAFLDELSAGGSVTSQGGASGEIQVEATLVGRSFPSMHFDTSLLNRLASTGWSVRITTGPRATPQT